MRRPGPAHHQVAKRLLRLVRSYPGLHLRELAREARISEQRALYHLDRLQDRSVVASRSDDGYRRFYVAEGEGPTRDDRRILALLRQALPLQIIVSLLERGEATHKELTEDLGRAKSTVSFHLQKVRDAGLLRERGKAIRLRDPEHVEALLLRWQPPESLTDRFAGQWEAFYGPR